MSEEITTTPAAAGTPPAGTPETKSTEPNTKDDWKKLEGMSKFKSEAELAAAYRELETKLGSTSEEVRQTREYAKIINPILEEIRNDPEIFDKLDKKLRDKSNPTEKPGEAATKSNTEDSTEMRDVTSNLILAKFEDKYGISQLPEGDAKKQREAIGQVVLKLTGQSLNGVDLRRLNEVLENAYVLANKDTLIEKSKLDALAASRANDGASIGSVTSANGKSETALSSEEALMASKLGLTREQYISGRKS